VDYQEHLVLNALTITLKLLIQNCLILTKS